MSRRLRRLVSPASLAAAVRHRAPAGDLLDPATGRDRLLGNPEQAQGGLTVSPDGKTILYAKAAGEGADLMMIENFR